MLKEHVINVYAFLYPMFNNSRDAEPVEPNFSSKFIRKLAQDAKEACTHLGSENGGAFIGLVADFRAARFAGDVPRGPKSVARVGNDFKLDWFVSGDCTLSTVVTVLENGDDAWEFAHRIRLESIMIGERVLIDV